MSSSAKQIDPAAFQEAQEDLKPVEFSPAEEPLDEVETIDGGRRVEVLKRNGSTEKVKIHQLSLDECLDYDAIRTQLGKCVDFFCQKPDGWNKTLDPAASLKIYKIGKAINQDFFDSVMTIVSDELDLVLESRGKLARKTGDIIQALGVQSPGLLSSPEKAQPGSPKT
jgi:hypothetical protein